MLDPEVVAEFASRMAAEEERSEAYQAIQAEFLAYAASFINQFSHHYHDFRPRPDGNIACTMDDYVRPRARIAYVIDTHTGFIWPVDKDVQRGTKYQQLAP